MPESSVVGSLTTLGIDATFFLGCCLGVTVWRWWFGQRKQSTEAEKEQTNDTNRMSGLNIPLIERENNQALKTAAQNYLTFLKHGVYLFAILSVISIPSYYFPLGWSHVSIDERGVRSGGARVAFDDCQIGFPIENATEALNCTPDQDPVWSMHEPGPGDPRPAAHYRRNMTLADCRADAVFCQAGLLAYEPKHGECWLFDGPVPTGNVSFQGFIWCPGRRDLLSGNSTFLLALVHGVIAVLVGAHLLYRLAFREVSQLSRHALWLTEIPTADREDGTKFELMGDEAFGRVAQDLAHAITAEINKRLKDQGITNLLYEKKVIEVYVVQESGKSTHLAGHAFAILTRRAYLKTILMRNVPMCGLGCLNFLPSYVHWRSHTLLKFGKPPWSAVTLRCQKAPPPTDIIWANLHVKYGWLGSGLLQCLLLVFVLIFVAPVSLASSVYTVVDSMRHSMEGEVIPEGVWTAVEHIVQQLPSYWLLLMDSIIVPYAIAGISASERPHLNSRAEATEFRLNLNFLLLNALFVPLLGFFATDMSLLDQAMKYTNSINGGSLRHTLRAIAARGRQVPGILILKYLMNAALVSTATQLIQVRSIFLRAICLDVEPWPFCWGYWYAWSMSILYIALGMSIQMPTVLPVATLSFFLMHRVHQEMFERKVFSVTFDMDRQFEVNIVAHIFVAAALLWVLTALFLYTRVSSSADEVVNLWILSVSASRENFLRALIAGTLISSAIASFVAGYLLFSDNGWLERRIWRKMGERASGYFLTACNVVGCALLIGAWFCQPDVHLENIQVRLSGVYASVLLGGALLVWLGASVMRWLGKRFVRGTGLRHLTNAVFDDDEHMDESDLVAQLHARHEATTKSTPKARKSFLIRRGSWYMPSYRAVPETPSPPLGA